MTDEEFQTLQADLTANRALRPATKQSRETAARAYNAAQKALTDLDTTIATQAAQVAAETVRRNG